MKSIKIACAAVLLFAMTACTHTEESKDQKNKVKTDDYHSLPTDGGGGGIPGSAEGCANPSGSCQ